MRIWRLCRAPYANEAFSGEGARRFGGRWNSRGVPMVYCSSSLALAAIELFVHLEPNLQPADLVSIAADLPDTEPSRTIQPDELPPEWWSDDFEPLRALGDGWIRAKSSLSMLVPSAPIHSEWNVLLNPLHPRMSELRIDPAQPFIFDARMFQQKQP
ncbi:MAG: RES family NAD+ phosphorylase [Terracidiphilus sp.]